MGRLTKYTVQMVLGSILVWALTVMIFTDAVIFSQPEETGDDVAVEEIEDGTYTGTGEGFDGPIEVEVTTEGNEIVGVDILSHSESPDISDPAIEEIPEAIVDNNSTDVDVASGATASSEGIMEAVNNALAEDGGDSAAGDTQETYEDGTYTGSAEGHNGPLEVEVTVENGALANVDILEHSESEDISDPAIEETPQAIVDNNSTDVDATSGATVTSEAIMEAVNNALAEDGADSAADDTQATYEDGSYTASVEAHNGPLEVEVTVENGELANVEVLEHNESPDISDPAIEETPQAIVDSNSTDVDATSGATVTSEAIMDAVDLALEDAQ